MCCCEKIGNDFTIQGADFTTTTQYADQFLNGRYRLVYNGVKKLIYGTDWEYINSDKTGGFNIILTGFSPIGAFICGEFY